MNTAAQPIYPDRRRNQYLAEALERPATELVRRPDAASLFRIRPMGIIPAMDRALANEDRLSAETRCSDEVRSGAWASAPEPDVSSNELPGSTLDFWRVQIYEPGRRLRLYLSETS